MYLNILGKLHLFWLKWEVCLKIFRVFLKAYLTLRDSLINPFIVKTYQKRTGQEFIRGWLSHFVNVNTSNKCCSLVFCFRTGPLGTKFICKLRGHIEPHIVIIGESNQRFGNHRHILPGLHSQKNMNSLVGVKSEESRQLKRHLFSLCLSPFQ